MGNDVYKQEKVSPLYGEKDIFFNVSIASQMQLIAIADNKANVITAINSILIAITIALFSSGFSFRNSPILEYLEIGLPLAILAIFCCVSALCSILALKPKIIRTRKRSGNEVLFFHDYYRQTLGDYKKKVKQVLDSDEGILDQLITYSYNNGLVLERKYQLLGLSYTMFLIAILFSGLAFIVLSLI